LKKFIQLKKEFIAKKLITIRNSIINTFLDLNFDPSVNERKKVNPYDLIEENTKNEMDIYSMNLNVSNREDGDFNHKRSRKKAIYRSVGEYPRINLNSTNFYYPENIPREHLKQKIDPVKDKYDGSALKMLKKVLLHDVKRKNTLITQDENFINSSYINNNLNNTQTQNASNFNMNMNMKDKSNIDNSLNNSNMNITNNMNNMNMYYYDLNNKHSKQNSQNYDITQNSTLELNVLDAISHEKMLEKNNSMSNLNDSKKAFNNTMTKMNKTEHHKRSKSLSRIKQLYSKIPLKLTNKDSTSVEYETRINFKNDIIKYKTNKIKYDSGLNNDDIFSNTIFYIKKKISNKEFKEIANQMMNETKTNLIDNILNSTVSNFNRTTFGKKLPQKLTKTKHNQFRFLSN